MVRAALFLAIVLGATAGMFILLLAEFVAWVQVLVYIGAVVVLLLFGVMLTRAPIGRESDLDNDSKWVPALVAVFLLGALVGHAQRRLRLARRSPSARSSARPTWPTRSSAST